MLKKLARLASTASSYVLQLFSLLQLESNSVLLGKKPLQRFWSQKQQNPNWCIEPSLCTSEVVPFVTHAQDFMLFPNNVEETSAHVVSGMEEFSVSAKIGTDLISESRLWDRFHQGAPIVGVLSTLNYSDKCEGKWGWGW